MAVAAHALLVTDRFGKGLTQRDADVFNGVMGIDVQIALGLDLEVDQPVTGNLIKHVVEERDAAREFRAAAAVEIQLDADLRFLGVTGDLCLACHGCL